MRILVEILPWLSTTMRPGTSGRIRFEHQLAGTTFRDLLEEVARADPAFAGLIYDLETREMRYPALAVVNEQLLEFRQGLETRLSEGDTVTFMAAYTGG